MRTRALALAATLLLALLAGCSGSSNPSSSSQASPSSGATSSAALSTAAGSSAPASSSSAAPSSSAPPSSSGAQNRAPIITALAAARPNATTLDFRFSFAASDPDGNSLTWMLDTNSDGTKELDGTTLPGDVAYSYPAAGLYNATLTVSDGKLSTAQTVAVNATLAVGGPLATIHTKWQVGLVWCSSYPFSLVSIATGPTPFTSGTAAAGVLYGEIAIPANLIGHAYSVDFGAPFGAQDQTLDTALVSFYDSADEHIETGSSGGGIGSDPMAPVPNPLLVTGVIPAGAAIAALFTCGNPEGLEVDFVVT